MMTAGRFSAFWYSSKQLTSVSCADTEQLGEVDHGSYAVWLWVIGTDIGGANRKA